MFIANGNFGKVFSGRLRLDSASGGAGIGMPVFYHGARNMDAEVIQEVANLKAGKIPTRLRGVINRDSAGADGAQCRGDSGNARSRARVKSQ